MKSYKIVKKTLINGGGISEEYFTGFTGSTPNFSSNSGDAKALNPTNESDEDKIWFNMNKLTSDHSISNGWYGVEAV